MNRLAETLVAMAASVPAAQARLDAGTELRATAQVLSDPVRALVGLPMLPRITAMDITLRAVLGSEQRFGAGIDVWPLGIGISVVHGTRRDQAATFEMSIVAVPRHASD